VKVGNAIYNEGGGRAHAEEKLENLFDNLVGGYVQEHPGRPLSKVEIFVSQSPCKDRCTPKLIKLKAKYKSVRTWVIYYRIPYAPTVKEGRKSLEAMKLLEKKGFHVFQFDAAIQMERRRAQ
jgi:hypothetical protein